MLKGKIVKETENHLCRPYEKVLKYVVCKPIDVYKTIDVYISIKLQVECNESLTLSVYNNIHVIQKTSYNLFDNALCKHIDPFMNIDHFENFDPTLVSYSI